MPSRLPALILFLALTAFTARATPNPPSGLTATLKNATTVTLSWTDNSTDETGFLIGQRIAPATGFSGLGTVGANTVTVDVINRAPFTPYDFVVVAVDATTQSALSNIVSVTTPMAFRAAYLNTPYSAPLVSSTPSLATGYAITALPPGLTLNPTSGLISGTPTTAGQTTGIVSITHSNGLTITAPLSIRVYVTPPALQFPTAGAAPADRTLTTGTTPPALSIAGLFSDPDVSSAARLLTDLGAIDFAFYTGSAPATVDNFLYYLNRADFNNTIFHRSAPGFVIQAGAFRADATASAVPTKAPVVNEPNITNLRGTVAMAKLGGDPNSATNQFFVNLGNNAANLDNQNDGFTVFARVAGTGMTVADAIAALPVRAYTAINSALTDTPVRGTPPASYDPTTLVRILSATTVSPLTITAASSAPTVVQASLTGTDLTLSPLAPGTATITLTATDLDLQSTPLTFQVTVQDAYSAWASQQNFPTPADATASADPDNDGFANLLEFALGSPPLDSASRPVLTPGLDAAHLTLTFTLANSNLSGTSVELQSATTPEGPWTTRWTPADTFTHPWILSSQANGTLTTITAPDPDPVTSGPRRFLRLKTTRP